MNESEVIKQYKRDILSSEDNPELYKELLNKHSEFALPKPIEKRYRTYTSKLFLLANKRFFTASIIVYALFIFSDYSVFGNYFGSLLFPFRAIVSFCLIVLAASIAREKPLFKNYYSTMCMGCVLAMFQIGVCSMLMGYDSNVFYTIGMVGVFMVGLTLLRHSFSHVLFFSVFSGVLFSIALFDAYIEAVTKNYTYEMTKIIDFNVMFLLLSLAGFVIILGIYLSYSIERLTRRNWLRFQIMKMESDKYRDLNISMQKLSETDSLTGLQNRRHFDIQIERLWQASAASQKTLSMIMIDVDWFKSYNDTYGHLAGDRLLQKISTEILDVESIGKSSIYRYGGEEFCVVLQSRTSPEVAEIATYIRKKIENLNIEHCHSDYHKCTVSIGVSTITPPVMTKKVLQLRAVASFIKKVDNAVVRAKIDGKNRVCVH